MNHDNDDPVSAETPLLGKKLSNVKPTRPPTEQKAIVADQMEKDSPAAALKLHEQIQVLGAANAAQAAKLLRWEEYDKRMMISIALRAREYNEEIHRVLQRCTLGTVALIIFVLALIVWSLMK